MKIYTAGPISGLSYNQVLNRYQKQTSRLKEIGYDVLCPMTGKSYLRNEINLKAHGIKNQPLSTNHAIKERDRWMVGNSDIILVDFTECENIVSIGSCMELAWGDELKKHTIVVMDKNNIHQHAFILECADLVFETMTDAYNYLIDLTKDV